MKNFIALAALIGITAVSFAADAGRYGGALVDRDSIAPGQWVRYSDQPFRGGEVAMIRVRGDGDGDIDCFVADENNRIIAVDEDAEDGCYMSWTPAWTGTFTIVLKNIGRITSYYTIRSN
jgi:hypothetical protein